MPTTNVIMVPWSWIKLLVFTTRNLGIWESKSPELSAVSWTLRKSWALSLSFLWRYVPWQPKAHLELLAQRCVPAGICWYFLHLLGCTLKKIQVCPKKGDYPLHSYSKDRIGTLNPIRRNRPGFLGVRHCEIVSCLRHELSTEAEIGIPCWWPLWISISRACEFIRFWFLQQQHPRQHIGLGSVFIVYCFPLHVQH